MGAAEDRRGRVCFTGHRPEKLNADEETVKPLLEREIRRAVDDGMTVFISGMARGVDIWAAETVLRLRDEGCPVRLICACPFDGSERYWSAAWQERYRKILAAADHVRMICAAYTPACFHLRNRWMVDHSARVIAVFDGGSGGTKNTIDYARRTGVPVVTIAVDPVAADGSADD